MHVNIATGNTKQGFRVTFYSSKHTVSFCNVCQVVEYIGMKHMTFCGWRKLAYLLYLILSTIFPKMFTGHPVRRKQQDPNL